MKKRSLVILTAILFVTTLSCHKSSGDGAPKGKSVLIKITVSPTANVPPTFVTGDIDGVSGNGKYTTWKLNDTTQPNQSVISFSGSDLVNGVITLEATTDVTASALDITGEPVDAQHPYTVTVNSTINGTANPAVSFQVTTVAVAKNFAY